jgi:RHS repeat-associated protein
VLWARHRVPESRSWSCCPGADPHKVPIDPNGNLTSKVEGTDTWTYTWNAENQLVRVEKNGVEIARFAYDPAGRRVEKVAGGVTTSYTYDSEDIVREIRGGTALKYVQGPNMDEPLAVDDGATLTFFHADALGSLVKTTNTGGSVAFTRQYDAWGNLQAGGDQPGYAFTGREWDPEAGLYFYRARYYDAEGGQFLAEDPVDYRNGVSRYAYVLDQPTNLVDPTGLVPCPKDCPPDVKQGKSDACRYAHTIQDANIRQCIERKCKESTIICDQSHNDCRGGSPGQTLTTTSILMCPGNPMPEGACWKRVIIHEMWIHQCRRGGPGYSDAEYPLHEKKRAVTKKLVPCP